MKVSIDISAEIRGVAEVEIPDKMIDGFISDTGGEPTDGEFESIISNHPDRDEILDVALGNLLASRKGIDDSYVSINSTWRTL